jgi:hypothetical protein
MAMHSEQIHSGERAGRGAGSVWVVVVATQSRPTGADAGASDLESLKRYLRDSPLEQSLRRARELAPRERICVVVAEEQRQWWRRPLWVLPASNIIAQPESAAVAQGVSRTILRILERDGAAKVVLLPVEYARGIRAIVGTARTLLEMVKRSWPKTIADVHAVASPGLC